MIKYILSIIFILLVFQTVNIFDEFFFHNDKPFNSYPVKTEIDTNFSYEPQNENLNLEIKKTEHN